MTVLALLVGFLFSAAPTAAQGAPDRSVQLGQTELVKRAATLRASVRSQADDPDPDKDIAPPPSPRIRTDILGARPAAPLPLATQTAAPYRPSFAYRARAPPAT